MARFRQFVPPALQADWASLQEAAELLAVSSERVRQLRKAKVLVSMEYDGGRVFVQRASITKHLQRAVARAR